MGYCGLPEEGHRGENYQKDMALGRQFTADFGSGEIWGVFEMIFQALSGFPIKNDLDDFDFSFQPSINKRQIDELV